MASQYYSTGFIASVAVPALTCHGEFSHAFVCKSKLITSFCWAHKTRPLRCKSQKPVAYMTVKKAFHFWKAL